MSLRSWLESLCADAVFGWRQIVKRKATSAAAVLSLALAIVLGAALPAVIHAVRIDPVTMLRSE